MAESRIEAILENMLGADNVLEPAQSRIEVLLKRLLDEGMGGIDPITSEQIDAIIETIE